jgi:hypothetical protein
MYYNTTNETKETVKKFRKINDGQDTLILGIIIGLKKPFSASLIYKEYPPKYVAISVPLTSIRRSINTLKNLGYIEETGKRVMGLYGRSELQYRLTNPN